MVDFRMRPRPLRVKTKGTERAGHRSRLTAAMVVAAVIVTFAAASGIPSFATNQVRTTGDEPHYLLTADVLGRQGTLDVSAAYEAERYRPYHDAGLPSQAAPMPDGSMLVPHDPLLPALLALPMRFGGWVAAKATLALMAGALAALVVWVAVVRVGVEPVRAGAITTVLGAAPPLSVYGSHVYPELPAALAVAVGIAALPGRLHRAGLVAVAGAVVALPWLGIKYAPVAAVLALLALVRLWRDGRRRSFAVLVGVLALAGVVYVVTRFAWYGGPTVYAAGSFFQQHGGDLSVVGVRPNYAGRSIRLLGLLVDAEFGIAAWQPAWLLAVPAVAALAARGRAGRLDRWTLLAPLAAGWLTATFVAATMHGWWFPGRQVVVVLPVLAVVIVWWAGASARRTTLALAVGAVGVMAQLWLAVEGWQRTVTSVVSFMSTTYPPYRGWSALLPDYRQAEPVDWVLHAVWIVVLVGLAAWGWRSAARGADGRIW